MKKIFLLFCFINLALSGIDNADTNGTINSQFLLDLEEYPSDFVLELKKIDILDHPHAFNPSIVRRHGKLLLSFREVVEVTDPSVHCVGTATISLIWLNDNFEPISKSYPLDFNKLPCRSEDARLIEIGDELYILYSNNTDEMVSDAGFRMWMAKLSFNEEKFTLYDKERLSYFDGEQGWRREKNWVPFNYQDTLCLAYSLTPHRILLPLEGTECCHTLCSTNSNFNWKWGELRGGTPAIPIDYRYLSFFHSSLEIPSIHSHGEKSLHYFIGAYTFSKYPPFEITHASTTPIIAKGFYSGEQYTPYWKPISAVFPCGLLVEKDFLWITYGRQDHEIWIAKLDKDKLLKSLSPVKNLTSKK